MKHLIFASLVTSVVACTTMSSSPNPGPGSGSGDPSGQGCVSDDCVCTGDGACSRMCTPNAPECHVQGADTAVSVVCDHNGECHVECSGASSCSVDCGGSTDCAVTCPAAGCTVDNCIGDNCRVTCGLTGAAPRSGSTAHCP